MNSKKWIIQYLEVLLDIIVMFTSYLIATISGGAGGICGGTFCGICR